MKTNTILDYLDNRIKNSSVISEVKPEKDLEEQIYNLLTTSKFRRHSMSLGYDLHIKKVIHDSVVNQEPIPLVWVFGCYKLWRLKEFPNVDWAELFFLLHKIDWLKPILSVYKPGVWFDFFADGVLVPRLNNISDKDIDSYQKSFEVLLDLINSSSPTNLKFTLNRLIDLYDSATDFENEFSDNYQKVLDQDKKNPFILTPEQEAVIRMNVKADHELSKVELHANQLLFEAFVLSSKRRPYYRNENKIFLDSFPIKNCLPVGTTRTSTVRFWVGKGVLRWHKESFLEDILSIKQLSNINLKTISIKGFEQFGNNFSSIEVLE